MKRLKIKCNGILYEGGFDEFSVNGSSHMEEEVLYKNNPSIEATKRLNMAYLLLTNSQMIDTIRTSKGCFFHGTNANALPSILKYGINSFNTSIENNIAVNTGEEWSRIRGKRSFVSLTDCLDVALSYADIKPNENNFENSLLNFGVVIGTSFENMDGLSVFGVDSDISEIGVGKNLPVDHIKFLAVPEDKVEFVKKMVGQKDIEVLSMDMRDTFFIDTYKEKLSILEQAKENINLPQPTYPIYSKDDVESVVKERRTSKIKEIFGNLKAKMHMNTKKTANKNIRERG